MLTPEIFKVSHYLDTQWLYPEETSKHMFNCNIAGQGMKLPVIPEWQERLEAVHESLRHSKDEYHSLFGSPRRTDSLLDLYASEALTGILLTETPSQHKELYVTHAHQVAKEVIGDWGYNKDKGFRAKHTFGNPLFVGQYLVSAFFLALKIDRRKALTILTALYLTKSRGVLVALILGFIRQPLWWPIVFPVGLISLLIGRFNVFKWRKASNNRRAFLEVCKRARADGKIYGYGNWMYALNDYFHEYMSYGQSDKQKRALYFERFSDKAHNEFAELGCTLGEDGLRKVLRFYKRVLWQSFKKADVCSAWLAHMGSLLFSFRTPAGNVAEAYLTALAYEGMALDYADNRFVKFAMENDDTLKQRTVAWKNGFEAAKALISKDENKIAEALSKRPLFFEGKLLVPNDLSKENKERLYLAFRDFDADYPNFERKFRASEFLKALDMLEESEELGKGLKDEIFNILYYADVQRKV